jgi:hypothetical protein
MTAFPLLGVFVATFLMVMLAIEIGFQLGQRRQKTGKEEKEGTVGTMVGTSLGLLAFLLAFTFGMAADFFQNKRSVLREEANAIGTTWLRADFLPESERDSARALLREYVDVRLAAVETGAIDKAMRRSVEIHSELWDQAAIIMNDHPGSEAVGLYITTLNEMIDLHTTRVGVALRTSIPITFWYALYSIAFLSFGLMGYHNGLSTTRRSYAAPFVAVTFSAVIWLIADIDTAQEGVMRVSQQALIDLRDSMNP